MKALRDWLAVILPVLTLALGMAWATGARDQRVNDLKSSVDQLNTEFEKLRTSLENLQVELAAQRYEMERRGKQ